MSSIFLVEVECYLGSLTVNTSKAIASGVQTTWTIAALQPMPLEGMWLRFLATGTAAYMEGVVVAVDTTTRAVTVDLRASSGSGTFTQWTATTGTLRFSTHPYGTLPSETPASVPYESRVMQAGEIARYMFDSGTTGGTSRIEVGDILLANADGLLDRIGDYGLDSRNLTIRVGEAREDLGERVAYPGGFTTVLIGTCTRGAASAKDFTLALRTRQFDVDQPFPKNTYAGTNALPAGLEGTADDLKGRVKPLLYGTGTNISPPCVNTSRLIYQVSDGAIYDVTAAYDEGVALTKGAAYTSQTDMETTAPAASGYRVWPAGGYFRVGSTPAGLITCDATESFVPTTRAVSPTVNRITLAAAGAYQLDAADNTAMLTTQPAPLELWISEQTTVAAVLDRLCSGLGIWWGFDRLGQLRLKRLEVPTGLLGNAAMTFRRASRLNPLATNEADILDLELLTPQDQGGGLPVQSVAVTYAPNWTVQPGVAGSVTAARRAFLAQAVRTTAKAVNTATATKHPLSDQMLVESLLKLEADAITERDRVLAMRSVQRDRVIVRARIDTATPVVDLGDEVRVVLPRYGFDLGKHFRVTGQRLDARAKMLTLDLWG